MTDVSVFFALTASRTVPLRGRRRRRYGTAPRGGGIDVVLDHEALQVAGRTLRLVSVGASKRVTHGSSCEAGRKKGTGTA